MTLRVVPILNHYRNLLNLVSLVHKVRSIGYSVRIELPNNLAFLIIMHSYVSIVVHTIWYPHIDLCSYLLDLV